MSVYYWAYLFVEEMERRFERGLYLRDSAGAIIDSLAGLLAAIEAGRWPVGVKNAD